MFYPLVLKYTFMMTKQKVGKIQNNSIYYYTCLWAGEVWMSNCFILWRVHSHCMLLWNTTSLSPKPLLSQVTGKWRKQKRTPRKYLDVNQLTVKLSGELVSLFTYWIFSLNSLNDILPHSKHSVHFWLKNHKPLSNSDSFWGCRASRVERHFPETWTVLLIRVNI